ncbi:XRE family transcriptional regulator [Streptomyces sp. S07_1.15]|uniref:helix-turn-helix domain-containing protein n=1 Tax=Streptomyces sp. S07_1.15 TaxID=2873925 RepID=UPI001D13EF94|nr:XRE family transcriptional regulator [Streptomyces sp. S07_1.15]MCC3655024.1 XRE family transcriptional regulator [Streptomyces sp. S07_1.15]
MTTPAPECTALAEGLRAVRARTGLSLAALARRTPYSKSSWERYLNGKLPAPRQAVEALCAMAGEPPGRLLALWELADAEWSGRARSAAPPPATPGPGTPAPPAAPGPAPPGAGRTATRPRPRRLPVLGAGAAVAAAVITAALWLPGQPSGRPGASASPALDPAPGCRGEACDGQDPDRMACGLPGRADALGPPRRTSTGARVEIRYSTVCDAVWGRAWHTRVGDAVEVSVPGATPRRAVIRTAADTRVYRFTAMLGGVDRTGLRVCFLPAGGTARECYPA